LLLLLASHGILALDILLLLLGLTVNLAKGLWTSIFGARFPPVDARW
jgi:hypothetical protein